MKTNLSFYVVLLFPLGKIPENRKLPHGSCFSPHLASCGPDYQICFPFFYSETRLHVCDKFRYMLVFSYIS